MAMERGAVAGGRWWRAVGHCRAGHGHLQLRFGVTKGANRVAVHGVKPPLKDTIRVDEEVEKEIEKGKEEKEKKRREVEKAVNSQAKTSKE